MLHILKKSIEYKIVIGFLLFMASVQWSHAAPMQGPQQVEPNSTHTYTVDNGVFYLVPNWTVVGGTVTSSGNNGTAYFAIIDWGAAGAGSIEFGYTWNTIASMNVTIQASGGGGGSSPTNLSDENYVYTVTPHIATTNISTINNDQKIEAVQYFDGLGRPMQSIAIRAGGNSEDIITHMGYDNYGRQDKEWLPYSLTANSGQFQTGADNATLGYYDATKYEADFTGVALNDINAFSQKNLEASPLNRVIEQAAPGKDWKLGNGHEIKFSYLSNISNEVRLYEATITATTVNNVITYEPTLTLSTANGGYYAAGELYKTVTKDENHNGSSSKLHTTEEFKDKNGQVILKRTYALVSSTETAHDTYYVYDDYGNLTYVLPPKAEPQTALPDATELAELCYQYKYDDRNRLVEKKIPGKGWEHIVYNKLDQPILTQDANLDAQNKWLFTKYDAFGRVAYTGEMSSSSDRKAFQNAVNSETTLYETKTSSPTTIDGTAVYYNNAAYPRVSIVEVLTINYYDNYTFDKVNGNSESSYGITPETNVKGLATGSKIRVLGTNDWITSVTYYDVKSRPIYVYSFNDYLNTTDKVKSKLDFTGKVEETTTTHARTGFSTVTTIDTFTYDHTGRLLSQKQKINSLAEETLVQNQYDDLGQLVSKSVGGKTTQGRLQNIDYTYNIRGWLKQINDPNNLGSDLFGFKLNYNTADHSGTKLYNGNIAETEWKTANTDNGLKWYRYSYDALNRITGAIDNTPNMDYRLYGVTYDKNGNITALSRRGHNNISATTFGWMDILTYSYATSSNKLIKVTDTGSDNYGFKEINTSTSDYWYDANGNMKQDNNKGIVGINYNHLNLPIAVIFSSSQRIDYIYDAVGTKLEKKATDGGTLTTTSYAGNYVYEGSSLKFFNHPEGYVDINGSSFSYVYQYKDHLGNVRLSYKDDTGVTNVNIDDDFNSGTDGWSVPGTGSINSNNQKLNISITNRWNNTGKYLTITPNVPLHIEFDFEKGTMANTYFFVLERINGVWESTSNRDYIASMNDGHYELDLTLTGDFIKVYFEKATSSDNGTSTTCYVDNFKLIQNGLEILEENNYYPFGLRHKGYNTVVNSTNPALKYKTYQGQEFHDELGLNIHEWKYRWSDPAIGRFWQIDPLAAEYPYNSTYAFQENKLGLGIELEGAELLQRMKDGLKQFFTGTHNLIQNETFGEAHRQMAIGQTNDSQKIEQLQEEGKSTNAQALGDMGEGVIETTKGTGQAVGTALENTGDAVTTVGIVTAQPEIIAAGETIGSVGTAINVTVDLTDGKPLEQIAIERVPSLVIGKLGGTATKAIRKSAGEEAVKKGETVISETIIKGHEKAFEKITNNVIENQTQPIKYEEKD